MTKGQPMRKCGCKQCRFGMHYYAQCKMLVRRAVRRFRHEAKAALKAGKDVVKPILCALHGLTHDCLVLGLFGHHANTLP